jgi:hypothetical protein
MLAGGRLEGLILKELGALLGAPIVSKDSRWRGLACGRPPGRFLLHLLPWDGAAMSEQKHRVAVVGEVLIELARRGHVPITGLPERNPVPHARR